MLNNRLFEGEPAKFIMRAVRLDSADVTPLSPASAGTIEAAEHGGARDDRDTALRPGEPGPRNGMGGEARR